MSLPTTPAVSVLGQRNAEVHTAHVNCCRTARTAHRPATAHSPTTRHRATKRCTFPGRIRGTPDTDSWLVLPAAGKEASGPLSRCPHHYTRSRWHPPHQQVRPMSPTASRSPMAPDTMAHALQGRAGTHTYNKVPAIHSRPKHGRPHRSTRAVCFGMCCTPAQTTRTFLYSHALAVLPPPPCVMMDSHVAPNQYAMAHVALIWCLPRWTCVDCRARHNSLTLAGPSMILAARLSCNHHLQPQASLHPGGPVG